MEFASKDSLMKAGILVAVLFFIYYISSNSPNNTPCTSSSDCASGQYCGKYRDGNYCLICPSCVDSDAGDAMSACKDATKCSGSTPSCGLSKPYFDADNGTTPQSVGPQCYECTGYDPSQCGYYCNKSAVPSTDGSAGTPGKCGPIYS